MSEKEVKKTAELETLENFDFSSDENFNIDENFEIVNNFKIERENLKQMESENILKDLAPNYLDVEVLEQFNAKKNNLMNLIRKYSADSEALQALSNEPGGDRDKIYTIATYLYNTFANDMNNIVYNVELSYEELEFITNTINHKLSYNVDEMYQVNKLKTDFLNNVEYDMKKLKKSDSMVVKIGTENLILLYHIINKYTTTGISKAFYVFMSVLTKIGETVKIFNALNVIKDRLNTDFQIWTASITPDENVVTTPAITSEKVEEPVETEVKKVSKKKQVK